MPFQIHAISPTPFAPLFALSDTELAARKARRMTVSEHPGTPCRVSLADAQIGETVLLVNHWHLPSQSPYAASHAVFVRQGVQQARPTPGEVPEVLLSRLISLRVFDDSDMMIHADAVEGTALPEALTEALGLPGAEYIHLHYAKPGCFAASVTRA
ncbi:DUF1203 domain-containing protein [Roseovarius nanhaiticus]|uniref:DUF1203 domain-containing protein n=1 Tax=Roseovarius nanhaiticus TaxID=573024 RepID=UPI002490AE2E|nr:DUF1203 domain-containing protein [Roseovarius nanhaiticus]